MKKTIVMAIALGLCTAGVSIAKNNNKTIAAPQDTSSVRQQPPISAQTTSQDTTVTPTAESTDVQQDNPQSSDTPSTNNDNSATDSAKVD